MNDQKKKRNVKKSSLKKINKVLHSLPNEVNQIVRYLEMKSSPFLHKPKFGLCVCVFFKVFTEFKRNKSESNYITEDQILRLNISRAKK